MPYLVIKCLVSGCYRLYLVLELDVVCAGALPCQQIVAFSLLSFVFGARFGQALRHYVPKDARVAFLSHAGNILLHGLASVMVLLLGQALFPYDKVMVTCRPRPSFSPFSLPLFHPRLSYMQTKTPLDLTFFLFILSVFEWPASIHEYRLS